MGRGQDFPLLIARSYEDGGDDPILHLRPVNFHFPYMIKNISLVTVATFFIEMVVGETWRALTGWKALRFQKSPT